MNGYDLQNETVEALGALHISGDTVPPEFFQHIRFANGKADYLACLILADILYWYRPIRPRDERTGQPLEWRQKFAGPRLVREYSALAERLGATDRQIRDACTRLKSLGFLLISVRPLFTGGSVVEMEPVYDRISSILRPSRLTAERESGGPTHVETGVGLRQNVSRTTAERESYKEAEISTETSHRESARSGEIPPAVDSPAPPSVQANTPTEQPALAIYRATFGDNAVNYFVLSALEAEDIADLDTWAATLKTWKMNGYKRQNLSGMIDRYKTDAAKAKKARSWFYERTPRNSGDTVSPVTAPRQSGNPAVAGGGARGGNERVVDGPATDSCGTVAAPVLPGPRNSRPETIYEAIERRRREVRVVEAPSEPPMECPF